MKKPTEQQNREREAAVEGLKLPPQLAIGQGQKNSDYFTAAEVASIQGMKVVHKTEPHEREVVGFSKWRGPEGGVVFTAFISIPGYPEVTSLWKTEFERNHSDGRERNPKGWGDRVTFYFEEMVQCSIGTILGRIIRCFYGWSTCSAASPKAGRQSLSLMKSHGHDQPTSSACCTLN